jgi:DNA recombination protein RmuC
MGPFAAVALFLAGSAIGSVVVFLVSQKLFDAKTAQATATVAGEARASADRAKDLAARLANTEETLRARERELKVAESQLSALRSEGATFQTRLQELSRVHDRMKETFTALSADALKASSDSFFQIAKRELDAVRIEAKRDLDDKERSIGDLLSPIRDGLQKYDAKLEQLAKDRDEAFGKLTGQLQRVEQASTQLSSETQQLARALRSPAVRGRWGEMQLRRVIEVSGMLEHCDFVAQATFGDEGAQCRPDVVIKLPGGRTVAVDAKVPLSAYLEALEATGDEDRTRKLKQHASQVRAHCDGLGKKSYWDKLEHSPEFVVLFLPSEVFFSAALEQDRTLLEESFANNRVIIATPTTLIALLQAVAYGWRQDSIARNAEEIAALGRELYERLSKLDAHFGDLGTHLEKAMKFYNSAVGTLESRVLVSARRFKDLGVGSSVADLPVLEPLELPVRGLRSPELTDGVVEA